MEKFKFEKQLGYGRFGQVWLVKCCATKKQYVLKQINLHHVSRREQKAAHLEAKLLSTLKHPNIVSYMDSFYNSHGSLFIIMGYCESGDLYNHIRKQNGAHFEEKQIVYWTVQICMALKYLHEKQILHRDLKTQNIFLTKLKIIKVGDLGIAKVLNSTADMASTLIGTPYYMSPEVFSNKPYNHKSDIWSLGCCVYEMATLKQAFSAQDIGSLMNRVLNGKVSSMLPNHYSDEFLCLVSSMLAHDPEERPSANEILLNMYIRKHILLFLKDTENCVLPENWNCSKSQGPSVKVQTKKKLSQKCKSRKCSNPDKNQIPINHNLSKEGEGGPLRMPDINGNGDGNDNSQHELISLPLKAALLNHNGQPNGKDNLNVKLPNVPSSSPKICNANILGKNEKSFNGSQVNFNTAKYRSNGLHSSHSDIAQVLSTPRKLETRKLHTSCSSKDLKNNGELSLKFLSSLTYTIQQARAMQTLCPAASTPCLPNLDNNCCFCGSENVQQYGLDTTRTLKCQSLGCTPRSPTNGISSCPSTNRFYCKNSGTKQERMRPQTTPQSNFVLPGLLEILSSSVNCPALENLPLDSNVDNGLIHQIMDFNMPNTVARRRRREREQMLKSSMTKSAPASMETFPAITEDVQ